MLLIRALVAVVAAWAVCAPAAAQWPDKPIRIIVPVGAGSANDIAARTVAEGLGTLWSQRVVVENIAGAGGIRGVTTLVGSPADGYTLGVVPASTLFVSPIIYPAAKLNLARDLTPVSPIFESPLAIAANPQSGINSMADLLRLAKAEPGKIGISTLPQNTAVHLAAEMLKLQAGINILVVPFTQPGDAILSAARGDTQLTIGVATTMAELVRAGRLKLLATTLQRRLPGFENVPAASETVPGYVVNGWGAMFAPTGTPASIIDRINRDIQKVLAAPEIAKRYAAGGMYPVVGSVTDLADIIKADRPGWESIARSAGKAE
ncbi:MAG: Bug family tripartite tricarboxylate transporter substrate binding protein [Burkholderiales bacterium]